MISFNSFQDLIKSKYVDVEAKHIPTKVMRVWGSGGEKYAKWYLYRRNFRGRFYRVSGIILTPFKTTV